MMMVAGVAGDLYKAAAKGHVNILQQLLEPDSYLLDLVSFPFSRNLLHIATIHGQAGIIEEILKRNKQLARDLDSQKWSPLQIAAAKGHDGIASQLLAAAPEMLWSRDGQGMNPVHVAAMNGHDKVLKKLVEVDSDPVNADSGPAKERVDRGRTALHLCAKHGHVEALKVLVKNVEELVTAKDDDGETLMHLAIRYKRVKIMKYLVESDNVNNKSTNSEGETALDIMWESFRGNKLAEVRDIINVLSKGMTNFTNERGHEAMNKISKVTMVVVGLIATMAYQSAVNPPGGVWQESSLQHRAGEAVMASHHPKLFKKFLGANTTAFISSLLIIFLITTNLPSRYFMVLTLVIIGLWVSLASIAVSYGASITVITPHMRPQSLDKVIYIVVGVCVGIFGLFYIWLEVVPWIKKVTTQLKQARRRGELGRELLVVLDDLLQKLL